VIPRVRPADEELHAGLARRFEQNAPTVL